ncbi:hypothetical protein AMATHDRAFT_64736 [Amanita thiersii Skay4041]|uniref:DUF6533 domain-containing protein n=1 Tax=Amanita thiersii Skay4041 TaxID=703135 RepID=A0A2A9NM20_9AGAR|nr:hypothetical protein AMATHDRAFT_64736 [Amanita thiersii Skay4041]
MIIDAIRYCEVAAATVLFFDYFLTLDSEVTFIWQPDWGIVKALFLLMRYVPFVDVTFRLYHHAIPSTTRWGCLLSGQVVPASITIGLASTEYLLAIRTWGLWRKHRVAGIVIFTLATGCLITILVLIVEYLRSVKFDRSPSLLEAPCAITAVDKMFIVYAILFLFELALLFATLIAGIDLCSFGTSRFIRVVIRDGVFYYIYLGALSAANVILLTKQTDYSHTLVMIHRVLHAVLAARVMFNLRANAYK